MELSARPLKQRHPFLENTESVLLHWERRQAQAFLEMSVPQVRVRKASADLVQE
jgi:hypothetical protein